MYSRERWTVDLNAFHSFDIVWRWRWWSGASNEWAADIGLIEIIGSYIANSDWQQQPNAQMTEFHSLAGRRCVFNMQMWNMPEIMTNLIISARTIVMKAKIISYRLLCRRTIFWWSVCACKSNRKQTMSPWINLPSSVCVDDLSRSFN